MPTITPPVVSPSLISFFLEYNDALRLALCAGQYLDISTKSEYVDTIIAKCIDEYKGQRELQEADPTVSVLSCDVLCRLVLSYIALSSLWLGDHVPGRVLRIVDVSACPPGLTLS